MRIDRITLDRKYKPNTPVVACIGYFDGVHKGHQALIGRTVELAKEIGCASALITFEPDPWVTIRNALPQELEHLTTSKQKNNLVIKYGIQNIYYLDFTKQMAALSPHDFIEQVLGQLNLKGLVCGYDFRFGAKGLGDAGFLKRSVSYPVEVIEEISYKGTKISSSRIVKCVKSGDFMSAYELLGHPFTMDGTVIAGRHIGATLNTPTVNLGYSPEYVIPRIGVYSGHILVRGKMYGAMINVGHNPTGNYSVPVSIETYIFNFNSTIYGERVSLIFEQYIREEKDFKNMDNLKMQLELDKETVRKLLRL